MRAIAFTADLFMGLVVGMVVYSATTAILPGVAGRIALVIVLVSSVLLVAFRRPGGSLRRSPDISEPGPRSRWSLDAIASSDVTTWTVPRLVINLFVAWLVSGLILAVAIPLLHAQGVEADEWIVWPVILLAMGLCVGPDVWRAFQRRRASRT